MTTAAFTVAQVGPLVTVQDRGRPGMRRFGVTASGPMDRVAFAIANAALGNPAGSPAIEISMGGLVLDCVEGSVTVAVAGGGFQISLDRSTLASWAVATIREGSRLAVRSGAWGSWTYLAFAGRLRALSWLGSASTHVSSGLGGGRITAGQRLTVDDSGIREDRVGEIPCPDFARPRDAATVVLGPQDRFFAPETIAALLSHPYTLTDAYDRMGVRLAGPSLRPSAALDMPSEPIVRGSIQVAGDGVPSVLLADHQTTGGYPKIATLVSADVDGFVQLRSRSQVRFERIEPEDAIRSARSAHREREEFLAGLQGRPRSLAHRLLTLNLIDGVVSGSE